jgi:hypothetical protein
MASTPLSRDVIVLEIKADFDPMGGEYTQINLGFRIPIPVPMPPPEMERQLPPQPKPVYYKHALHLFIPRDRWEGQYTMWEEYHLITKSNGELELKKKQ